MNSNPLMAEERTRKREYLLQATERELQKIVEATRRTTRRLKGADRIGLRVGKVLGKFKMAKHFRIIITDNALRLSIVAPARQSTLAQRKASTKRTDDLMPVHSFQTLLKDLATITKIVSNQN